MQTHAYKIIQTQLTGKSLPIGSLRMSWDSDTCLKIREHSLTISLERSQERREISNAFPMISCAILFPVFAHLHVLSFRSMGSVDFYAFLVQQFWLQGPVPAAFVWDFAGDSTSDQTAINVRKEAAPVTQFASNAKGVREDGVSHCKPGCCQQCANSGELGFGSIVLNFTAVSCELLSFDNFDSDSEALFQLGACQNPGGNSMEERQCGLEGYVTPFHVTMEACHTCDWWVDMSCNLAVCHQYTVHCKIM